MRRINNYISLSSSRRRVGQTYNGNVTATTAGNYLLIWIANVRRLCIEVAGRRRQRRTMDDWDEWEKQTNWAIMTSENRKKINARLLHREIDKKKYEIHQKISKVIKNSSFNVLLLAKKNASLNKFSDVFLTFCLIFTFE